MVVVVEARFVIVAMLVVREPVSFVNDEPSVVIYFNSPEPPNLPDIVWSVGQRGQAVSVINTGSLNCPQQLP